MISLIMHASLPVQLIMALLVALSVISWSFIVSKLITLRAVWRSSSSSSRCAAAFIARRVPSIRSDNSTPP